MFEKIRKPGRTKGLFAYIIFFLICLVFVFLGVPINSISGAGGFAAVVNREGIPLIELNRRVDQIQRSTNQGQGLNDAQSQRKKLNEDVRSAVSQLVNEALVSQEAQNSGLAVSDAEVRDEITSLDVFKENGVFKTSLYLNYLQSQRLSVDGFENQIKKFILNSKVERSFNHAIYISTFENRRNQEIDQVQIQLQYIRIPLGNPLLSSSEQEEQIQKWQSLIEDSSQLEKELKAQKLVWSDSNMTSLRNWETVLPFSVDVNKLFDEVVKVIPHKKIIPYLFSTQEGIVLVALKNFEMGSIPENRNLENLFSMNTFLAFGLSRMLFSQWLDNIKNGSKVQINPRIFN